jgi:hypothetical protein
VRECADRAAGVEEGEVQGSAVVRGTMGEEAVPRAEREE